MNKRVRQRMKKEPRYLGFLPTCPILARGLKSAVLPQDRRLPGHRDD